MERRRACPALLEPSRLLQALHSANHVRLTRTLLVAHLRAPRVKVELIHLLDLREAQHV